MFLSLFLCVFSCSLLLFCCLFCCIFMIIFGGFKRSIHPLALTETPRLNATHTGTNRSSLSPAEWHFVDRNRHELIYHVSNVVPILDHLLQEKVLKDEQYDEAMTKSTTQDKMRFLLSGPLKSAGDRDKDVLLSALKKYEPHLIEELERKG
uniref:CARD domain-containing protein n=1 Tax=Neogobius melanostomus TaxID=47308 RepID=A0A8C6SNN9_9GOBI